MGYSATHVNQDLLPSKIDITLIINGNDNPLNLSEIAASSQFRSCICHE